MLEPQPDDLAALSPYDDQACVAALPRVLAHPAIQHCLKLYFANLPKVVLDEKVRGVRSVRALQEGFIDPLLKAIEKASSSGLSIRGLENLSRHECYVYISNHRDIVLDSALFTDLLLRNGFPTPKICLGDNLLVDPLVVDLVKMNKGVTVKRNLGQRELLRWSLVLSELIRKNITQKIDSVWIAQQEGRSKDGKDETHPGVLKMLALRGEGTLAARLKGLHLIPVAISYEYDTSDVEKALELHTRETVGEYHKKPQEDVAAILRGFKEFKGGIHIEVGRGIDSILEEAQKSELKSDQVRYIAAELDKRIRAQYHNWPTNYIAHDELSHSDSFGARYSGAQKEQFFSRLEKRLDQADLSAALRPQIRERVLKMYAASV